MNTEVAQERIKTALKQVLKKQNHTYSDVAKVWECSLPTVKRLLGKEELPLSKLLTLLDWLNLTLSDLQKLSESENLDQPTFTLKQNEFLTKNPATFAFLMKLYEGESPATIAKKYGLTAAATDRHLIFLEKHDLIRVGTGGKPKPAHSSNPKLSGPLGQAHYKNILDGFNTFFKYQIGKTNIPDDERGSFQAGVFEVRPSSWKTFCASYERLRTELEAVSKLEALQYKPSELYMGIVSTNLQLTSRDNLDLKMVNDPFGHLLTESVQI